MSNECKCKKKSVLNELIEREADCTWRDEPTIIDIMAELGVLGDISPKGVPLDIVWAWLDNNPSDEVKRKVLAAKGYDLSILK